MQKELTIAGSREERLKALQAAQKPIENSAIQENSDIGRPTVMTDVVLSKLETAFAIGASDKEACIFAGIAEKTLYRYQAANEDFRQRKALLKTTPILKARENVITELKKGDKQTSQWYLEKKVRDEFGKEQQPIMIGVQVNIDDTRNRYA